jgi:hypothetical protein
MPAPASASQSREVTNAASVFESLATTPAASGSEGLALQQHAANGGKMAGADDAIKRERNDLSAAIFQQHFRHASAQPISAMAADTEHGKIGRCAIAICKLNIPRAVAPSKSASRNNGERKYDRATSV